MKLQIKKFAVRLSVACAVAMFGVGCSSSAADEPLAPVDPDDAPVEIVLNGGISLAVDPDASVLASVPSDTRAIINADHDALPISILRRDATDATPTYPAYSVSSLTALNATLGKFVSGSTTAGEMGEISFATTQYYQTNGFKTKLIGWHPQVGTSAGTSTFASGVVTCNIDGDTDIMLSDEQAGDKTNKISTALAFSHLLTQIQVSAYAATDDAKTVWGGIVDVSIKDEGGKQCEITLPSTVNYGVPTGSSASDLPLVKKELAGVNAITGKNGGSDAYGPAVGGGTANPLELGVLSGSTKNEKLLGYAMFAPLVPASGSSDPSVTLTLKVTTEKGTKDVPIKLTGAEGFKEGKAYKLTLKFTATGIVPLGTITGWVDHTWGTNPGDFNGEIEL